MARAVRCARLSIALSVAASSWTHSAAAAKPGEGVPGDPLIVSKRRPLAVAVISPGELSSTPLLKSLLARIAAGLRGNTRFDVDLVERSVVVRCSGELACLVRGARPDYRREELLYADGTPRPYEEHLRDLGERGVGHARYLLLVAYAPHRSGRGGVVHVALTDADQALHYWHEADRSEPGWKPKAEAKISALCVLARPDPFGLEAEAQIDARVNRLLAGVLRTPFRQTEDWGPLGEVVVRVPVGPAQLALDGVALGTRAAGVTRLIGVPSGEHSLVVDSPGYERYATSFRVCPGCEVEVAAALAPTGVAPTLRSATFWGGVALAAAGVGITAYALALESSYGADSPYCLGVDAAAACGTDEFIAFGAEPPTRSTAGGVLVAPLGYSLVGAGGIMALGTALFGEPTDLPWAQIAVGVAAGAVAYGLSAVLNGRRFPE